LHALRRAPPEGIGKSQRAGAGAVTGLSGWQAEQAARCGCGGADDYCPCQNVSPADKAAVPDRDQALRLAYGLLWHMRIDRRDDNLRLASDARRALLAVLSKDEQADGIARAKATDARFTGAA
jgi:hypothetical protein